ncbi:MAG: sigma-54-dependent transcriptional regulator [Alphaproteobacteria bacterium]
MSAEILIVDDEEDIRNLVKGILEDEGYKIRTADNSDAAYEILKETPPSLAILDIWLEGSKDDGIEILKTIKRDRPDIPVLMISGHGSIETAVSTIKIGAYDFIEKPFKSDRLILMIQRALETAQLRQENAKLRKKIETPAKLIGSSSVAQNLAQILKKVAQTNSRVLLTGEQGAGKEIAARYLHNHSSRADEPFFVLSCANLRPDRLEIELFGSEENGSGESVYTGILERANGGTLLLDEVADMPPETQGKIVRVLQNQSFQRVGGNELIDVDVRIIASTNKNLEKLIAAGEFRQDLYYRLNVVPISVPPLRERMQDIPELTAYFSEILAENFGVAVPQFSKKALIAMQSYNWPGNIRQLRNVVEWVMIMNGNLGNEAQYDIAALPPEISGSKNGSGSAGQGQSNFQLADTELIDMSLRDARESFEKIYLSSQIGRFGGNVSKTAQFIGMERSALHRKLKSLDIAVGEQRDEAAGNADSIGAAEGSGEIDMLSLQNTIDLMNKKKRA